MKLLVRAGDGDPRLLHPREAVLLPEKVVENCPASMINLFLLCFVLFSFETEQQIIYIAAGVNWAGGVIAEVKGSCVACTRV